jgi:serine/threonine protein kinase
MKCPKCHFENPADTRFCGKCGIRIRGHVPDSLESSSYPSNSKDASPMVTETLQTPVKELTTGSTFAGRYQVIEELGRGGMGKVYRALDKKLNEEVAIKLIKPEIALDKGTLTRFQNELKVARKISHRNVGRMYELMEDQGLHFITMEYVPGEDLRSFLHRSKRLAIGTAVDIAKDVCDGLAEAHRLGVVHRDLKPSNIIIDKDGNARIMDFGIARSMREKGITGPSVIIGTPEYMSPEQMEAKETDPRSDIYSLGVILYEMTTGRLPFEGQTTLSIAVKHKTEIPKDPREFNPQIPQELDRLILKCLEKEREKRYQRADDILAVLNTMESSTLTTGLAAATTIDTDKMSETTWKRSIAVLPFSNLSPDKEQEYFCDGLAEEIINALSHVRDLKVVARTSAFSFKGKDIDLREVGKKLNVDAVLEGSVRKAGDRLRITAQLINIADGYHLWSERFDRAMKDVFDIQDEVTLEIVDKLKIELLGKEKERVVKRYTENLEAHNLLLKGRYFWAKRTKEGLGKGMECVRQALEVDPAYALAYAHLASNYISLGWLGFSRPHDAFPKAKAAAQKALEIDGSLPQAHSASAFISLFYDWDWAAAEKGFKKALSLNPGYEYAHWGYGSFLLCMNRLEEALAAIRKALEIDPLSLSLNADLGAWLRIARRDDEAQEQFKKTIDMDPNFGLAHYYMGILYSDKGMYKEAIPEFRKAIELTGGLSWAFGWLASAYAMLGQKDDAGKILLALEERSKEQYIRPTTLAPIYFTLGDIDRSFECLEKAIEERDPVMAFAKVLPELDIARSDPLFKALLKRMNLEQ